MDKKTDEDSISRLVREMKKKKKIHDQQEVPNILAEEALEKGISVEQLMYIKKLERALEEKKQKGKIRDTLMAINEWVAIVLACIYTLMCFELYNITATKGEYIAFIGYTCFHYFAALIILYIAVRGIICFAEYIAKKVFKSSKLEYSAIVYSSDLSRNRLIIALGCPIVIILSKILL